MNVALAPHGVSLQDVAEEDLPRQLAEVDPSAMRLAYAAAELSPRDVTLLGTKAMLVARAGLSDAIVDLLLDAARDVHAEHQGIFDATMARDAGELSREPTTGLSTIAG